MKTKQTGFTLKLSCWWSSPSSPAMLLPAKVKSQAVSTQCKNNRKQMGLAKTGKDAEGCNSWTYVSSWLTCQRFRIGQPKAVC